MPIPRIPMRQIREVLRSKYEAKFGHNKIFVPAANYPMDSNEVLKAR